MTNCCNTHLGKEAPTLGSILWSLRSIGTWGATLGVGTHSWIQWAPWCGMGGHRRSRLGRSKLRASLVPLHVGHEPWNTQIHRKAKSTLHLSLENAKKPKSKQQKKKKTRSYKWTCSVKLNVYWGTERMCMWSSTSSTNWASIQLPCVKRPFLWMKALIFHPGFSSFHS